MRSNAEEKPATDADLSGKMLKFAEYAAKPKKTGT